MSLLSRSDHDSCHGIFGPLGLSMHETYLGQRQVKKPQFNIQYISIYKLRYILLVINSTCNKFYLSSITYWHAIVCAVLKALNSLTVSTLAVVIIAVLICIIYLP